MPKNQALAQVVSRAAVATIGYVLGWLAMAIVFAFTNGSGLEAAPNAEIPYFAGLGLLFGAALGWWWLLSFPALQFYGFEPLWNRISYDGPIYYVYDRPGYVLAGTLGIAAGLVLRFLYQRARAFARPH
jgi:putative flippase GtrA